MKVGAIVQARVGSSRLSGKVLMLIKGKTVLEHIITRVRLIDNIDEIVVATTKNKEDSQIVRWCKKLNIKFYQGSEADVLERFAKTAKLFSFDIIVRITADDLFIDPDNIGEMIKSHIKRKSDLTYTKGVPLGCGLGMIVISRDTLNKTYRLTDKNHPRYREHIDEFVLDNPEKFKINILTAKSSFRRASYRLTLDTEEDLRLTKIIFNKLYKNKPIMLSEVINFLDKNTDLLKINSQIKQR